MVDSSNADGGATAGPIASWTFAGFSGEDVEDTSGNGHVLHARGGPAAADAAPLAGAVALDGSGQWLEADGPVIDTEGSYSVAAWVRLDSAVIGGLSLAEGWFAVTAVSQSGPTSDDPTHCPFYLGARLRDHTDPMSKLCWCLTVAPVDGSTTQRDFEWEKSFSQPLQSSVLDQWVLLVGVVDRDAHTMTLHVPATGESDTTSLTERWPYWRAAGPLLVGHGLWLGDRVDWWPGSVGPIQVFDRPLAADEIRRLALG